MLCLATMFAACQSTPGNEVVISKDFEKIMEEVDASGIQEAEYPKRWEAYYEKYNNKLKIDIDADVVISYFGEYSAAEIEGYYLPIVQADKIIETLFGTLDVYHNNTELTKKELEEQIITAKSELENARNNNDAEEEKTLETRLGALVEELRDAPEEAILTPYNSEYKIFNEEDYIEHSVILRKNPLDKDTPVLSIYNINDLSIGTGFKCDILYGNPMNEPFFYFNDADLLSSGYPEHSIFTTTDAKKAIEISKKFLSNINVEDREVSDMVALTNQEDLNEIIGYRVFFSRKFNDVLITPFIQFGGYIYSEQELFAPPYYPEILTIDIVDDEITRFEWNNMFQIKNIKNSSCSLMPFDKVMENVEDQLAAKYAIVNDDEQNCHLYVDEIILTYAVEPIKNGKCKYILIPAWGFYGGVDYSENPIILADGNVYSGRVSSNTSLLTINAIDGSIITGG